MMTKDQRLQARIQATEKLQTVAKERNVQASLQIASQFYSSHIFNDLRNASLKTRRVYQDLLSSWDAVIQQWWFSDNEHQGVWQQLLLPKKNSFPMATVWMHACWLRFCDSPLLQLAVDLPDDEELKKLNINQQAKRLGRFCCRVDSMRPLEFSKIAMAIHKKLLPFFIIWTLRVYLLSPYSFVDQSANQHRQEVIKQFVDFFTQNTMSSAADLTGLITSYRAAYYEENTKFFIETLVDKIFKKSFMRLAKQSNNNQLFTKNDHLGMVITNWWENHPVFRCVSPVLERIRQQGMYIFNGDPNQAQQQANIPAHWRETQLKFINNKTDYTIDGLAKFAMRIKKQQIDFLFYPEVGLNLSSRWLSMLRLARVQALTYGHPVTSGSSAMDYFVGGNLITHNPKQYTERLVLLPGFGVSTTPPPAPTVSRRRPFDDQYIKIFNQSFFDKLNGTLLTAWQHILQKANRKDLSLHLYPGMEATCLQHELGSIKSYLSHPQAVFNPLVARQTVIDDLVDADIYLDSYPFGGFNTLVEVLCSGCPVVTWVGDCAQNSFAAAMLRELKLPAFLIARNFDEYITSALKLIKETNLRLEIREQLNRERVLRVLCREDLAEHFAVAVEWMRAQGPYDRKKHSNAPVYIEAGSKPKVLA